MYRDKQCRYPSYRSRRHPCGTCHFFKRHSRALQKRKKKTGFQFFGGGSLFARCILRSSKKTMCTTFQDACVMDCCFLGENNDGTTGYGCHYVKEASERCTMNKSIMETQLDTYKVRLFEQQTKQFPAHCDSHPFRAAFFPRACFLYALSIPLARIFPRAGCGGSRWRIACANILLLRVRRL